VTSPYAREIERWARMLSFPSDGQCAWDGAPVPLPSETRLQPAAGYPPVVAAAAEIVYERGYLRGESGPAAPKDRFAQIAFAARLHEANAGTRPNKGSSRLRPGWYYARSDVEHAPQGRPVARVYWNVGRAGAGLLMRAVTSELNAARAPFHLKVVDDPLGFARADSAVLYVERAAWETAAPAIERAHAQVAPYLRAPVPPIAKRLARGVAAADDPPEAAESREGPTESFGTSRCRLVAEGVWDAQGGDAVSAVRARFARAGISLDAPYLNAGSHDIFSLRLADAPLPDLEARP